MSELSEDVKFRVIRCPAKGKSQAYTATAGYLRNSQFGSCAKAVSVEDSKSQQPF